MRRFYAAPESFGGQTIVLSLEESGHLRDVLRLRAGESVSVFDGAGNEFIARVEKTGGRKESAILRITEKTTDSKFDSELDLTLAAALLKGEKFDLVVQKACEIGVARLVPLRTDRADVKINDAADAAKKLERWRKISIEAAKQCGRARLMKIESPQLFADFIRTAGETRVLFAERSGESFRDFVRDAGKPSAITAAVGAEGGWNDAEIRAARDAGFQIVTFGGRILRAETAAIVVAALAQNHFGDLN